MNALDVYRLQTVRGGVEKTRLLWTRLLEGSLDPVVRRVAQELVHTANRNDHIERLTRLHRFVRDCVDYHREPIEMFQSARTTLNRGGDCDCLVILLGALAWSLRYPVAPWPYGPSEDPSHYSILLGWPPSDEPTGAADTQWIAAEASCQARFGETADAAGARRALL